MSAAGAENSLAAQERAVRLQNRLHSVLDAMFSGNVLLPNKYHPGVKANRLVPYWADQINEIRVHAGGEGALDPPTATSDALYMAAETIAAGYSCLDRMIGAMDLLPDPKPIEAGYRLAADRYRENPRAYELLRRLQRYWLKNGAAALLGAYVHGSYSTADCNAYSDLDALIILKREVACDPQRLFDFAKVAAGTDRLLIEADILQHHAHFVLTEIDLNFYCDAYFPRVLFSLATELWSEKPLVIGTVRDSQTEAYAQLRRTCQRFMAPWQHKQLYVAYHLKMQLSNFMILPALLLQVIRRPCYKRDSFSLVRPMFDQDTWQVMDEVSEVRRTWRQTSAAPVVWLARTRPILWRQLISYFGAWGVPRAIWRRVQDEEFRGRIRKFAEECLEIASKERSKPSSSGHVAAIP